MNGDHHSDCPAIHCSGTVVTVASMVVAVLQWCHVLPVIRNLLHRTVGTVDAQRYATLVTDWPAMAHHYHCEYRSWLQWSVALVAVVTVAMDRCYHW
jgi:hypothetical protein